MKSVLINIHSKTNQLPSWPNGTVGRALHQCHRSHGFEFCSGLNFIHNEQRTHYTQSTSDPGIEHLTYNYPKLVLLLTCLSFKSLSFSLPKLIHALCLILSPILSVKRIYASSVKTEKIFTFEI